MAHCQCRFYVIYYCYQIRVNLKPSKTIRYFDIEKLKKFEKNYSKLEISRVRT